MKIRCVIFGCCWKDQGIFWSGEVLMLQTCTRCASNRTVTV